MRILAGIAATILLLSLAACGGGSGPDKLVQVRAKTLQEQLELTPEQTKTVEAALTEGMARLRDMMDNPGDDMRGARQAMRDVQQSVHEKVSAVLDDHQREQLDTEGIRLLPSTMLIELDNRLDLTTEQIEAVEEIMAAGQDEMRRVRAAAEAGQPIDRERMMEIRENQDIEIAEILNEKQRVEYKKMLEERQARFEQRRGDFQP